MKRLVKITLTKALPGALNDGDYSITRLNGAAKISHPSTNRFWRVGDWISHETADALCMQKNYDVTIVNG